MSVLEISSTQHPVKAGLSDAFMIGNSSPDTPGESGLLGRDGGTVERGRMQNSKIIRKLAKI